MTRRPVLLIDGYNVLNAEPAYAAVAAEDLERARNLLLEDAAVFAQAEWRCTVVFDGGGNPDSRGEPHGAAGVVAIFSAYGHSADEVIEALAARARERGEEMTVVTSDAAMQSAVFGGSVHRMSSRDFHARIKGTAGEWRDHSPAGSRRTPVESRISDDVRRRLERLARGSE